MPGDLVILLVALSVAAALFSLVHPTVRRSLVHGAMCLGRHPNVWRIPAFLGLAYGLFQTAAVVLLLGRSGENLTAWLSDLQTGPPPSAVDLLELSGRSALDALGSTFHTFTVTFPVSALFGLRFLLNVDGVFGELRRALRRRLPRRGGWLIAGLALSALASMAKPFAYLLLPELTDRFPQRWVLTTGAAVNLASVAFEVILGFFLLTYFLLIAHLWLRDSHLDHRELVHLTCHRLGFVCRWAGAYLALAAGLIFIPQWAAWEFDLPIGDFVEAWAQPIFAIILFVTALIPVTLVFRNFTLAGAATHAIRLLQRRFPAFAGFFGFAAVSNLLFAIGGSFLTITFGADSVASQAGRCVLAVGQGILAGWLVVSLACLYKAPVRSRIRARDASR